MTPFRQDEIRFDADLKRKEADLEKEDGEDMPWAIWGTLAWYLDPFLTFAEFNRNGREKDLVRQESDCKNKNALNQTR